MFYKDFLWMRVYLPIAQHISISHITDKKYFWEQHFIFKRIKFFIFCLQKNKIVIGYEIKKMMILKAKELKTRKDSFNKKVGTIKEIR